MCGFVDPTSTLSLNICLAAIQLSQLLQLLVIWLLKLVGGHQHAICAMGASAVGWGRVWGEAGCSGPGWRWWGLSNG